MTSLVLRAASRPCRPTGLVSRAERVRALVPPSGVASKLVADHRLVHSSRQLTQIRRVDRPG